MPFIHEHTGWPDFTWSDATLAAPLAAVRHRQGRLIGKLEALGFEIRDETGLSALTGDVVKSWAIEGEALDAREVRSSIARHLGLEAGGLPKATRNVDGIVELMLDATRECGRPLTAERLGAWHAALFPTGRSGLRRITVGGWRTAESGPMEVVSGPPGRERVHFEAPEADRVDVEMRRFIEWFNAPLATDPVIKAGVAHFWFLTIHPFEDGNGRIARAVADMSLARADATTQRFYSMSTQIEAERMEYYRRLERSQRGGLDVTAWLEWFLACMGRAIDSAEASLAATLRKADLWLRINRRPVSERQRGVINRLMDGFRGGLTSTRYARLAKCSHDTALRDVHELLGRRILLRNEGGGRSTSYRLGTLEEMREA
ncbi:MAG: Fic family protein [Planctomycetes bacterium]|nr:Fic family protein [Planctomycetota bacterium]